jgi:hypothetical protein
VLWWSQQSITWSQRPDQVIVGYEHGYSDPPMEIRRAALALAKMWLVGRRNPIDDRAITFNAGADGGTYSLAVPGRNGSSFGPSGRGRGCGSLQPRVDGRLMHAVVASKAALKAILAARGAWAAVDIRPGQPSEREDDHARRFWFEPTEIPEDAWMAGALTRAHVPARLLHHRDP